MQKILQGLLMSVVTAGVLAGAAGSADAGDHATDWKLSSYIGTFTWSLTDGTGGITLRVGPQSGQSGQVTTTSYYSGFFFQHRAEQQCWDGSFKEGAWTTNGFLQSPPTPTCANNGNTGAGRGWIGFGR